MDNLGDILQRRDLDEPPEVRAIKDYVRRYYDDAKVRVLVQPNALVITGSSAPLIASLRLNLPKLQAAIGSDKKILFRIG